MRFSSHVLLLLAAAGTPLFGAGNPNQPLTANVLFAGSDGGGDIGSAVLAIIILILIGHAFSSWLDKKAAEGRAWRETTKLAQKPTTLAPPEQPKTVYQPEVELIESTSTKGTFGTCRYCGKPASFLRNKHNECEEQYLQRERIIQDGRQRIFGEVSQAIKGYRDFDDLEKTILGIEKSFLVPPAERKRLLVHAWERCVQACLEHGIIDQQTENRLVEFKYRFALTETDLNRNGSHTTLVKAMVLRELLNGIVPQRFSFSGSLPINFQKGEQLVWAFTESKYLEDKVRREYVGGSRGVSVRVMKGVYYRAGEFKGRAVEHIERVLVDSGSVFVTNKNLYFAGPRKSLRVPYTKIVSFEAFSDGVGITRDTANAKPQIFITGDGWFTYNLVINLSKL